MRKTLIILGILAIIIGGCKGQATKQYNNEIAIVQKQDTIQQFDNLQSETEDDNTDTDCIRCPLIKDLDGDGIMDSVYMENSRVTCCLSTQNFKKTQNHEIEILNYMSYISDVKNGFYFENHWMRAGYKNQFRYDSKAKRIQLIGMSRYEFGNVANDGSGESSINLLTNDYIGDWSYFDEGKEELIKIPTIKTKMSFGKIYLEDFSEETYFGFAEKCAELYHIHKEKTQKKIR